MRGWRIRDFSQRARILSQCPGMPLVPIHQPDRNRLSGTLTPLVLVLLM
jgi:hypothetical protein